MSKNNILFVLCIAVSLLYVRGYSQEKEKMSSALDFKYLKKGDGSKLLSANLYSMVNRRVTPISKADVNFIINDTSKILVKTDIDGNAFLIIDKDTRLKTNDAGEITVHASFDGNDTLEGVDQEILFKDAVITLSFEQVDSIRTVKAHLAEILDKDTLPASDQVVRFYVPRMFSLLKIAEETTDEEGNLSFEFPIDLPGKKDGTITVVARLDDNETYANVEKRETLKWGVPIINPVPETHRTLWTEVAPLWMIITLSIMLAGVWGHYIFTIIQLIIIRKDGRNTNA